MLIDALFWGRNFHSRFWQFEVFLSFFLKDAGVLCVPDLYVPCICTSCSLSTLAIRERNSYIAKNLAGFLQSPIYFS
jgi:hypothetical protein